MGLLLLLILASSVLSLLYWVGVAAIVMALAQVAAWLFWGVAWIISRPIVWFIIRPFEFITGRRKRDNYRGPQSLGDRQLTTVSVQTTEITVVAKVDQLHRLQGLRDNGTISPAEFDKLKGDILSA